MAQKGNAAELGTENIRKLLVQYAVPAIIAMTASSLYNMVDSIFIGHGVGPLAISGLAITFPLMNLAAAFGSLVGVGASTLISVKLGQKDYLTAQQILGNVVSLNVIIGVIFTVITLLFLDPILYFFGASEATIPYARDYMITILLGNVVTHMYLGLNSVLRSAGHPQKAMIATILTVVINTILDPLFIYTFDMGIRGAAVATILAQIISLCWLIRIFCNKEELLHFQKGIYRLKGVLVENIIGIGMAPFLMNMASCFIVILINKGLKLYDGDLAIGAFGIVNRIVYLFVMIVMGLNQGMQPIAGYNFGAQQYHRVNRVMQLTVIAATIVGLSGRRTYSGTGRFSLHHRPSSDRFISRRTPGSRHVLSHYRLPDGNFQLLPEHRNGQESHYPVFKPSGTYPDSLPAHSSSFLGSQGNLVQHADFRCTCQSDCGSNAL